MRTAQNCALGNVMRYKNTPVKTFTSLRRKFYRYTILVLFKTQSYTFTLLSKVLGFGFGRHKYFGCYLEDVNLFFHLHLHTEIQALGLLSSKIFFNQP
jgi:hypothetical protein